MKLGVCPQPFYDLSLEAGLDVIADLGLQGLELPLHVGNPWIDAAKVVRDGGDRLRRALEDRRLELSAVSIHQDGQLLLGPHHTDTDVVHAGDAAAKSAFADAAIRRAGDIAAMLGVDTVVGFVGCEDYARFFPWPDPVGWERMLPAFRERMLPILDHLADRGVRFAQEPHPKQIVYNTETALESLDTLGRHQAWGFNLDPANLFLAGCDPVIFVAELNDRVLHVHGKDAELVAHHAGRSGLLAHGRWDRKDRGFRFRVPGWGGLSWRRIVSELIVQRYDGFIAIEHEDPLFGRRDGVVKAIAELRPLLPTEPPGERWW
ncbi:MAG: sugar phosphate isomerase/epimerase [Planctomycetes bacterium]|nr:sugar phosphate isomerase/epimerase [Planctomycetota bacterium]